MVSCAEELLKTKHAMLFWDSLLGTIIFARINWEGIFSLFPSFYSVGFVSFSGRNGRRKELYSLFRISVCPARTLGGFWYGRAVMHVGVHGHYFAP